MQDVNDLSNEVNDTECNKVNDIESANLRLENVTKRKRRKGNTQGNENKKVVAVIGDSMLKNIQGYKLSNKDQKVVVKSFAGANTECMLSLIHI